MSEPKWYCVDTSDGDATVCIDKDDAEDLAAARNRTFKTSEYIAVQLVDAAELEEKKVEHEIMYARLSDELKASQRDLNTALARIAELEVELEQAWLEYGRATSLACALNN